MKIKTNLFFNIPAGKQLIPYTTFPTKGWNPDTILGVDPLPGFYSYAPVENYLNGCVTTKARGVYTTPTYNLEVKSLRELEHSELVRWKAL